MPLQHPSSPWWALALRSVAEARMAGVSQGVTLEVWEPRTVTEGPAERLGVWEEHGVQGSRGERVSRSERLARSLVPTGHVRRGLRAELGGGHGGLVTSREPLPWGCGCGNRRGLSTHCQRSWKTARQPRAPLLARGAEQRPWRGQAQSDG